MSPPPRYQSMEFECKVPRELSYNPALPRHGRDAIGD
jgi:hypothetical protein